MPSLAEAYGRRGQDRDRALTLVAGATTFGLGVALLLGGVVLVSLEPGGRTPARRLAGLLGGLGFPAVLLGIVALIPAHRTERATTLLGAALCGGAAAWFYRAYPDRWFGFAPGDVTLEISLLYVAGAALSLWFVLRAVATFKTRNDPGGTVTLEIEREGETRLVEVDPSEVDSPEKLRRRVDEERAD